MAESIDINSELDNASKYAQLLPQIKGLLMGETDLIAALSNTMAALKYGMDFFWVGCYFIKGDELVLGPFQGPVACTRIGFGQGVCGAAWKQKQTIIVKDVDAFPGHIACSADSRSEIVLPLLNSDHQVALVLDVDSVELAAFDEVDQQALEQVLDLIKPLL